MCKYEYEFEVLGWGEDERIWMEIYAYAYASSVSSLKLLLASSQSMYATHLNTKYMRFQWSCQFWYGFCDLSLFNLHEKVNNERRMNNQWMWNSTSSHNFRSRTRIYNFIVIQDEIHEHTHRQLIYCELAKEIEHILRQVAWNNWTHHMWMYEYHFLAKYQSVYKYLIVKMLGRRHRRGFNIWCVWWMWVCVCVTESLSTVCLRCDERKKYVSTKKISWTGSDVLLGWE